MYCSPVGMATTSHPYSLRARRSSKNGQSLSGPAGSLSIQTTTSEGPIVKVTPELRTPKKRVSAKMRDVINTNLSTAEVKRRLSNKRRAVCSKTTTTVKKRTVVDVTDIEDFPSPVYSFAKEEAESIKSNLLSWYDGSHRVLPWRQNPHSSHQISTDLMEVLVRQGKQHGDDEKGALQHLTNEIPSAGMNPEIEKLKGDNKREGEATKRGRSQSRKLRDVDIGLFGDTKVAREFSTEQQRAYEVWVSELMLQQTQVATVIGYYLRWMELWPTVHDLAQASQETVNSIWAGLGYYRRARSLLEGAKQIVENCSGVFPESLTELKQLPGIGSYTAGAIASIAFQKPVPVVDGNVIRVLCRLRAISDNPTTSNTKKLLWTLAGQLVDAKRPGDLNQAIMELGATVCTSSSPSCSTCPIASQCKALSLATLQGDDHLDAKLVKFVTKFPVKVCKAPRREEFVAVCLLEVCSGASSTEPSLDPKGDILLMQRPQKGLLAGLWEFPSVSLGNLLASAEEQKAAMDSYLKETLGLSLGGRAVKRRELLGNYVHIFSHIRMHMSIEWLLLYPSGDDGCELQRDIAARRGDGVPVKWVATDAVSRLGLTTSVRKIFSMYLEHRKPEAEREFDKEISKRRTRASKDKRNKK